MSARAEIEGYAARFHDVDLTGDRIIPGAFRRAFPGGFIPAAGAGVRMLYQHQAETPIGRWTEIKEDKNGLFVRGEIFLSLARGEETFRLLEGGAIDGLSIGFKTKQAKPAPGGRSLIDVDLWEVSIVTFPMSPRARVTRVSPPGGRLPRNLLA